MSLRKLPEIRAERLPSVCAFEADPQALDRWNSGISAAVQAPENTITILEVVGEDPFTGGGVTAKRVAGALRSIGPQDIFVDINSPGGDYFEGVAIYNMLREHPKSVTVRILGMAASAASLVAMAGDQILIGKAGFMMLHNAWVMAVGNRHDLEQAAKTMEPFDDAMATVYSERAGVKKAKAVEWLDNETWFNGTQAVDAGLADDFLAADQVSEDATKAELTKGVNATRRIDALLAKSGIPKSERRALLTEAKGSMSGAAPTGMSGAAEIAAAIQQLRSTIRS